MAYLLEIQMLLDSKKAGALLRCFALEAKLVDNAVALAMASIERMLSVQVSGRQFISRIEVLVPMDDKYVEKDCGETTPRLRQAIQAAGWKNVYVSEVQHGDIFVGILNYGVGKLLRAGMDYGVILSKEAEEYSTPEAAEDLVQAASSGARLAGIAINELTKSIMEGRIANTFAIWHLMSLVQVGVFDLRNAKPQKDSPIVKRAQAWDQKKTFWHYDLAGTEEIIPSIRLVRTFGPCLAPILPRGEGVKIWKAPDPQLDPDGYIRHINKLGTKFVRQAHFADQENVDLSFLKGGIMEAYRHPEYVS